MHRQKKDCKVEHVRKQLVECQKVLESKIKKAEVEELDAENFNINGKKFPTSSIGFPISASTVIRGVNAIGCSGDCPPATPGTPTGGLFVLQNSFKGKVVFCGVQSMALNLSGLVLSNDGDYALEFINCSQVYVYSGSVNSVNSAAVHVNCSTNIFFQNIYTSDSYGGLLINDSTNIRTNYWEFKNVNGFALKFNNSNFLRFTNLDINSVTQFKEDALIMGNNSEMIFINNSSFYDIDVKESSGIERVLVLDKCFDVKINNISILTTYFSNIVDTDLSVYLIHVTNSGSVIMSGFMMDGNGVNINGNASGELDSFRIEESDNVFALYHMMTDNFLLGTSAAKSLEYHAVHVENIETFSLVFSQICTNYLQGEVSAAENLEVRAFYGTGGGNWYLGDNTCNASYMAASTSLPNSSVYGFEVFDVNKTVVIENCTSDANGPNLKGLGEKLVAEVGGYKIASDNSSNNTNTNILINKCQANSNCSNITDGKTLGFVSTYSNTTIQSCQAVGNVSGFECYGIFLPGLVGTVQSTVSITDTISNNNLSYNSPSYGLYAGKVYIDGWTNGVDTLVVKNSIFNSNGPEGEALPLNPGFGVYLNGVDTTEISNNVIDNNNYGISIGDGGYNNIENNKLTANNAALTLVNSPNSIISNNVAQGNDDGFIDTTVAVAPNVLNSYFGNKSIANTSSSFDNITPAKISWHNYSPSTGTYTFISGEPIINPLTNISVTL